MREPRVARWSRWWRGRWSISPTRAGHRERASRHDGAGADTAPGDLGKIIGRQGRTAAALRTLAAPRPRSTGSARSWTSRTDRARDHAEGRPGRDDRDPIRRWRLGRHGVVGRIARPHGCAARSSSTRRPISPRSGSGRARRAVHAAGGRDEALTIATARVQHGRPVVGFDGVETIETAEAARRARAASAARGAAAAAPGTLLPASAGRLRGGDGGRRGGRDVREWRAAPAAAGWSSDGRAARCWFRSPTRFASDRHPARIVTPPADCSTESPPERRSCARCRQSAPCRADGRGADMKFDIVTIFPGMVEAGARRRGRRPRRSSAGCSTSGARPARLHHRSAPRRGRRAVSAAGRGW